MFRLSKIKYIVLSVVAVFSLLLSGCAENTYQETQLENGEKCYYFVDDSQSCLLKGVNIPLASRQEILNIQSDDVEKPKAEGKIRNTEKAAVRGVEVLNKIYENWTYKENTVGVRYN